MEEPNLVFAIGMACGFALACLLFAIVARN